MREDSVYLTDILDQTEIILSEAEHMTFEEFENRPIYKNGMILSLVLIGEAAKRLSKEFKTQYPDLPISLLARTRDKLIHGYQGTDYFTVWEIITQDIPELNKTVRRILGELQ